jgi:hypothetical protein
MLALVLAFPSAAMACLNDSATDRSEREFRSSYQSEPAPAPSQPWLPYLAGGAGVALLVGGVVVSQLRRPA